MPTLNLSQIKSQHDKWLRKHNVHPDQLKKRKRKTNTPTDFNVAHNYYGSQSNTIAPPAFKRDIFEQIRTGNETPQTIAAIKQKSSQCIPLFNKGGMQFSSNKEELKNGNRKNIA